MFYAVITLMIEKRQYLTKNLPESMKAREDIEEMRGSVVGLVHHVGLVHQAVGCHEGSSMADHRHRATLPNLN